MSCFDQEDEEDDYLGAVYLNDLPDSDAAAPEGSNGLVRPRIRQGEPIQGVEARGTPPRPSPTRTSLE